MNRTVRNKLLWVTLVAIGLCAAFVIYRIYGPLVTLASGLFLLLPGRLAAHYLRDLFLSRRFIGEQRFEEASEAASRFLVSLDQQPWRQHFIYCVFGIYTWNTRAMALNNRGAAKLNLGRPEEAEMDLDKAIVLDGLYPMPYFNLALIASGKDETERSQQLFSKARKLGMSGDQIDKTIMQLQGAYAKIQTMDAEDKS